MKIGDEAYTEQKCKDRMHAITDIFHNEQDGMQWPKEERRVNYEGNTGVSRRGEK